MGTLNTWFQKVLMQSKAAIIKLKKQTRPIRKSESIHVRSGGIIDLMLSSGTNHQDDHGKQLKWMMTEIFL